MNSTFKIPWNYMIFCNTYMVTVLWKVETNPNKKNRNIFVRLARVSLRRDRKVCSKIAGQKHWRETFPSFWSQKNNTRDFMSAFAPIFHENYCLKCCFSRSSRCFGRQFGSTIPPFDLGPFSLMDHTNRDHLQSFSLILVERWWAKLDMRKNNFKYICFCCLMQVKTCN